MNIALEKCEEHVNGVKKRSYGDAFIRGNNGTPYTPFSLPQTPQKPEAREMVEDEKMDRRLIITGGSYVHFRRLSNRIQTVSRKA